MRLVRLAPKWLAVCGCAGLLLAPWPARAARSKAGDVARDRVLELLERDPKSVGDQVLVRELVALGAGAVSPAIEVLAGQAPELASDPERAARIDRRKALLWDAFDLWPVEAVTTSATKLARGDDVEEVLLAVRILGRRGMAPEAQTAVKAVCALDSEQRMRTRVQLELERALAAIMARDSTAAWQISKIVQEAPNELLPTIVRGVGHSLRLGGVPVLEGLLNKSADLDQIVLAEIANIDPRDRQTARTAIASRLGKYLSHADQRLRKQAALSLGRLHDFGSVERLIAQLDESEGTGQAALQALRQIAGQGWTAEAGRWTEWRRVESLWLDTGLPRLEQEVRAANPGRVSAALRELGQHRALRDEIAPCVVAALGHADSGVTSLACTVAAAARCDAALGALVALLEREDESVRMAALAALRSISGVTGQPDAAWWQDWMRG